MIRVFLVILFYSLLFCGFLQAQSINLGSPFTNSFPKKTYNAGTQNWDIVQDSKGIIYFANNQGMLQYDGKNWSCHPLPNKTIVRSLAIDNSGIIYVGGQNELGYFAPNQIGDWTFHSLKNAIPKKYQNFEDVWEIVIHQQRVYFRTSKWIYCFFDGKFSIFHPSPNSVFNFLGILGESVIVQDSKRGLNYIQDTSLVFIPDTEVFTHGPITNIFPIGGRGEWLITTLITGFFKFDGKTFTRWQPDGNNFFLENKTYSSAVFNDGRLAFGTSLGGLVIVHPDGKILHHLTKENGLLNNNVLSMMTDNQNNLWLGLDDGINYVLTGSPFTHFSPDGKSEGAGYSILEHGDKFYFGTSNGLFSVDRKATISNFDEPEFQPIKNTKGQVWGLNNIDKNLLLGHHGGGRQIENGVAKKMSPDWGYWGFEQINSNQMIAGTYKGLVLYNKINSKWIYQNHIDGFKESSRFLEKDKSGDFWISHPYKGIFKLNLKQDLKSLDFKFYGKKDGLPSDLSNYVFKINNELIFCGIKGVFTYNDIDDRFYPYPNFNEFFGIDDGVRRLFEAANGNIWYVTEKDAGVLKVQEKSILKEIRKVSFPQLREHLVGGFELIYPFDDDNVFIGTEKGFIHYNPKKQITSDSLFQVILSEVSITSPVDSLIFRGIFHAENKILKEQNPVDIPKISPQKNALRFGFAATDYTDSERLLFQFKLEGSEKNWSNWTLKTEKEYTNLDAGDYTFQVKAKNINGKETDTLSFQFTILPYWYKTSLAYLFYFLFSLAMIAGWFIFFNKKYKSQKEKVKTKEKEVSQLKHEKLKIEVAHKNQELASSTFHLVHKNELLSNLKTSLLKLEKKIKGTPISNEFGQVIRMLEQEEDSEIGWTQFIAHFDKVHTGFFDKLKNQYPNLSPKDLKMCAYLRMNLSTKEIAALFNITIRSVEGGRYRLRKKMGLDSKENLTDFILKY